MLIFSQNYYFCKIIKFFERNKVRGKLVSVLQIPKKPVESLERMKYTEFVIEAATESQREMLIAELSDYPFDGFTEEEDCLKAYIPEADFRMWRSAIEESLERNRCRYTAAEVPDRNWNTVWESNFEPIDVEGRCRIRAPFHSKNPACEYDVEIMPKMSFGTGHHATTYLMAAEAGVDIVDCAIDSMSSTTSQPSLNAVVTALQGQERDTGLAPEKLQTLSDYWADVRLRYAQQQAKFRRLPLSREQLLLIAQHCPDVRRLSGVILRVASHRSLLGRDLSEQDLLNIVRQGGDSSALTPQLIVSIVGEHCGVPAKEILGEKRRPDLVQARQLAMYLCRELLGHSYPVIGRMFGGKDHSTVMHGVKKIKLLQESDRLAHSMVTELTKACLEHRG